MRLARNEGQWRRSQARTCHHGTIGSHAPLSWKTGSALRCAVVRGSFLSINR